MTAIMTTTSPIITKIKRMSIFLPFPSQGQLRTGVFGSIARANQSFSSNKSAKIVSATPTSTNAPGTGWPNAISHKITHDGVR